MLFALVPAEASVESLRTERSYIERRVRGWTIHVEKRIEAERPRLESAAMDELARQLGSIERIVADEPLTQLKRVPIWMHLNNPANPGAAFHPSREWLIEHAQNSDMAGAIEIGNLEHFVLWTYEQPWMLMHELAHAYQFRVLPKRAENPDVLAAFRAAVASHRYDAVLRASGRTERAYALTNAMEYFAETTEAYFGRNDFYPFLRAELERSDPKGAKLMRKIWGDPVPRIPKEKES